jgi:probable HAF family extracellular repeat protein
MQDLGTFGGFDSGAYGISADGSVIVGMANDPGNNAHAFRWTATTGLQFIGTMGGMTSQAFSVSADGLVIVGRADDRAFRWTAATGMQDIGTLGGIGAAAYDVSGNGSVIVGDSSNASGMRRAFKWTAATGMKDLSSTYAGSIGSGSYLVYANAVSADGLRVTGYGYNRSANRYVGYLTP